MTDTKKRKSIWGWMSFDFASQPFHTLLVTFIFAPYFTSAVAANDTEGQAIWGFTTGAAGLLMAITAPVLGAIADTTGPKKPWIAAFSILYLIGSFTLWYAVPGLDNYTFILIAFAVGIIGVEYCTTFSNAMLPEIVDKEEVGQISGTGWALGYVGGLIALLFILLFVAENNEGTTLLGNAPMAGLDPDMREGTRAFLNYLLGSMFYRDALIGGVYAFGGIFASTVLGWSIIQIGIFGILALITGALGSYIGGRADRKFGPKLVIYTTISILLMVSIICFFTSRTSVFGISIDAASSLPDIIFYICGALIGAAGGALQAASRTMLVHLADPNRMTEAFGLYALSGKATSFITPISIGLVTTWTGDDHFGIFAPIIVLFLIGIAFLMRVKRTDSPDPVHA